jgi:hypothetical protein
MLAKRRPVKSCRIEDYRKPRHDAHELTSHPLRTSTETPHFSPTHQLTASLPQPPALSAPTTPDNASTSVPTQQNVTIPCFPRKRKQNGNTNSRQIPHPRARTQIRPQPQVPTTHGRMHTNMLSQAVPRTRKRERGIDMAVLRHIHIAQCCVTCGSRVVGGRVQCHHPSRHLSRAVPSQIRYLHIDDPCLPAGQECGT